MRVAGIALVALWALSCSSTRTRIPDAEPAALDSAETTDEGRRSPMDSGVLCASAADAPDAWWVDAVFYEVFVRSFQDSDGDGIGDLRGLIDRLDYLNDGDPATTTDLGVDALWLMPIQPSPSYHGYDVTDYRGVNPEYGTLDDLKALLDACDARGIRVVIDLVMNHTSSQHPWFVKGKRAAGSPHDDWYVWSDQPLDWGQPWDPNGTVWHPLGGRYFYGVFWSGMPDLNYRSETLQAEMLDVAAWWATQGVHGFRLDAARYLVESGPGPGQSDQPETHAFWKTLRERTPEMLLVGEVWTDFDTTVSYFGQGDELQMLFGFDRAGALRDGLRLGTAGGLGGRLCEEVTGVPTHGHMGSFATNHDMDRLATVVGAGGLPALKLAGTLLMTMPGTPFLYYGQELGLANGPVAGDPGKRLPMRWDDSAHFGFTSGTPWQADAGSPGVAPALLQAAQPGSLVDHYRRLTHLRQGSSALRRGRTFRLEVTAEGGSPLAYVRRRAGEAVLVVANLSPQPARNVQLSLPLEEIGLPKGRLVELDGAPSADWQPGEELGPYEAAVRSLSP